MERHREMERRREDMEAWSAGEDMGAWSVEEDVRARSGVSNYHVSWSVDR